MTGTKRPEREALDRLADGLVDDILNTSDEDILAEFRQAGGDPDRHATEMRALFETTILAMNKSRLAAAKAGVAETRKGRSARGSLVDIAEARKRLRAIFDMPNVPPDLTLAARKESELTDTDILGMIDDLRELGVFPPENGEGGKP